MMNLPCRPFQLSRREHFPQLPPRPLRPRCRGLALLGAALMTLTALSAAEWTAPDGRKLQIGSAPQFQNGDRVLWAGDSITRWHWCYFRYIENFYLTRYPERKIHFFNGGISGSTVESLAARFAFDVACWNPTYISLMMGMNDTGFHHFLPDYRGTPEEKQALLLERREAFKVALDQLLRRMLALPGLRQLVIVSPTFWDQYSERDALYHQKPMIGRDDELGIYAGLEKEAAAAHHLPFIDWRSVLLAYTHFQLKNDPAFSLVPDRCHPGEDTHVMLARTFLAAQRVTPYRGRITVNVATGEAGSQECALSEVKATPDAVTLRYRGEALPLILEDKVKNAPQLLSGFDSDFRGELVLAVSGLKTGNYELWVDGGKLGSTTAEQLAAGVDLVQYPGLPDRKQAQEVIALNGHRISRQLDTGRLYVDARARIDQQRKLAARQGKPLPEDDFAALDELFRRGPVRDEGLMKSFYELGKPEAIAAWRAEFDQLTDKLYQMNQPQTHRLELRRVN